MSRVILPTVPQSALFTGLALACLLACQKPAEPPDAPAAASLPASAPTPPEQALSPDDTAACAGCHAAIVEEWRQSIHSRACRDHDPIFAAMLKLRVEREGATLPRACAGCHSPLSPDASDADLASAGVACAACHNLDALHTGEGKAGAAALQRATTNLMRTGRDLPPGRSPVHATGPGLPALADGKTLCLACHDRNANPAGVPTCTTGVEFNAASSTRSCVACHMPDAPGPGVITGTAATHRSHAFPGAHAAWDQKDTTFLGREIDLQAKWEGEALVVTLHNKGAHAFPTGFPGRMALLVAVAEDGAGQEVWRNVREDPMKEHPEAVLNQVFLDAEGQPTLAAWSVRVARDARLKAGEQRAIRLTPPAEAARVKLLLRYGLLSAPLAMKLGLKDLPEASPVTVKTLTLTRQEAP